MAQKRRARSWSQLEQYRACPFQFYLARIERKWQKPAAWTAMGTAVHAGGEFWERSMRTAPEEEALAEFRRVYNEEINKELSETPNTAYWEASGPYKGEDDIPRRREIGQEHVQRYITWYQKHPEQKPWTLSDGRLALELKFTLDLGGVPVRGVIDWIGNLGIKGFEEKIGPRDTKSGAKPGKLLQLKIYGIAVEDHFAANGQPYTVTHGDFLMTKTGKATVPQNLTQVTRNHMVEMFQEMDAKVNEGEFPPNPGEACARCPVKLSCKYREG